MLMLRFGLKDYQPRTLEEVEEGLPAAEPRALEKLRGSEPVRKATQDI